MPARKPRKSTNRTLSISHHLFVSHSSQNDAFVRELQLALSDQGVSVWIDSRDLLPGGLLEPDIKRAIDEAAAFAVVVSPAALQSRWVGKEIAHAIKVQKKKSRERFPVIPLSLDGTKLGVLEEVFRTEPTYISVKSAAGGAEEAVHPILVAVGRRKSGDVAPILQTAANPLEDLVLELTHLKFEEKEGVRRASAEAQLIYEPATPGQSHVHSAQSWSFIAPSARSRRRSCAGIWKSSRSGPASTSGTAHARWKRTSRSGDSFCTTPAFPPSTPRTS
jgi:hypothetical protein